MSRFQTDALRPSGLPSANLGRPRGLVSGPSAAAVESGEGSSKNKFWDDWNTRIDGEVKAVAEGLGQLVELADIGKTPIPHAPSLSSLHLPLRTSQLIKATQQLRDTAHELRLMLLLSDEVDIAAKRDEEARRTRRGVEEARGEVVDSIRRLMGAKDQPPDPSTRHAVNGADESKGASSGARETGESMGAAPEPVPAPATANARPEPIEIDDDDDDEEGDDDEGDGDFEEVS